MELEVDRQLLDGYRRGDARVLDRLYRHFSPVVLRYLSRGFPVRQQREDSRVAVGPLDLQAAHQETFIRAFGETARLRYDGLSPFAPYLLAVARSAAIDVLRGQGKLHRHAVPLEDAPELPDEARQTPEEQALQAEAAALVASFLGTLDEADRRFATSRFIEGLSQEKAGAACGLSRQEARTREARLKAKCLKHLASAGWMDDTATRRGALALLTFLLSV